MPSTADSSIPMLLILLAVNVVGIFAYALISKAKMRRERRNIAAIKAAILDYFRRSGVEVDVECDNLPGPSGFTAMIESEPMKRFRLSHIIEMTLRDHVRKSCSLELNKIYWRFPVKQATQQAAQDAQTGQGPAAAGATENAKPDEHSDEYINEGLEHYRHIPKPEVEELPWEHFEQVATGGQPKKEDSH